jgi:hypothetical protein
MTRRNRYGPHSPSHIDAYPMLYVPGIARCRRPKSTPKHKREP